MRLTTIATVRGMELRERIRRAGDRLALLAARALPARVRYWTWIQGSVDALDAMPPTTIVPDVRLVDALQLVPGGRR